MLSSFVGKTLWDFERLKPFVLLWAASIFFFSALAFERGDFLEFVLKRVFVLQERCCLV